MQELPKISPYALTDDVWMVPCEMSCDQYKYLPICKPQNAEDGNECFSRQTWLLAEDNYLAVLVNNKGPKGWSSIARELNLKAHNGKNVRHGKQCRERYYNHLDPQLNKGFFASEEDLIVLRAQAEIGNKWSLISKQLPGRTENQVKNRYKSLIKQAKRCCPQGRDPVSYLILELEALKREQYLSSSLDDMKPLNPQAMGEKSLKSAPSSEQYDLPLVGLHFP